MSLLRFLWYKSTHGFLQTNMALKIFRCSVRIDPRPRVVEPLNQTENCYDEKNMKRGRPMTPFISIYETQLQGVMSIHNRIAGSIWTLELFTFALAALILPESVEHYVDKINSWNLDPIFIYLAKCLIAWPMVYHTIDGTRHLLWDFGMILTNKSVCITGYIVVILSVAGTLYLSFMV